MLMKCAIVIVGELLLEEPLGPDFIHLDQSCVERARQLLGHATRRGRRLRHFPELSWPANFSRRELREWIAKIDDSKLRVAVTERWDALRHKTQP